MLTRPGLLEVPASDGELLHTGLGYPVSLNLVVSLWNETCFLTDASLFHLLLLLSDRCWSRFEGQSWEDEVLVNGLAFYVLFLPNLDGSFWLIRLATRVREQIFAHLYELRLSQTAIYINSLLLSCFYPRSRRSEDKPNDAKQKTRSSGLLVPSTRHSRSEKGPAFKELYMKSSSPLKEKKRAKEASVGQRRKKLDEGRDASTHSSRASS